MLVHRRRHLTYHVGNDRSWRDDPDHQYRDHNLLELRRVAERCGGGRKFAGHRYFRGRLRKLRSDTYGHLERPESPPPSKVFAISPGRSGSEYLATVLGSAQRVRAYHEPEPTMSDLPLKSASPRARRRGGS